MNEPNPNDDTHLKRTIELAKKGLGYTSPNPMVGAVVVKNNEVIGEGWHARHGQDHAERVALQAAETDTQGADLYISLEPCCHHGLTPPCTEAIISAGIKRVIIASDDPSKKASGNGIKLLRKQGIEVQVADGDLAEQARLINQPFRKHTQTGRPWVLFKYAMSLDGKVATKTGDSKWISSQPARDLVHQWRSTTDAIAIGIGTALSDDPLLTARTTNHTRQPQRIIFDSSARLPHQSQLVRTANDYQTIVIVSPQAQEQAIKQLTQAGVKVIIAEGDSDQQRIKSALDQLGSLGITSVLLEGGPSLAGAFIDAQEIDELRIFIAPIIIGGKTSRHPLEGVGAEQIAGAIQTSSTTPHAVGEDVLLTARLREW